MAWEKIRNAPSYALLMLVTLTLLSRLLPIPFGFFIVASNSMLPSIRPLDMGVILGGSFKVGDIVVWSSSPLYYVMHRVVNIDNGTVITKGDANPIPDPPILSSQIKGRVALLVPREVWLFSVCSLLGAHIYTKRRILKKLNLRGIRLLGPLLVYCLFVASITSIMAPSYGLNHTISHPDAQLSRIEIIDLNGNCAIKITYYFENIELSRVLEVKVNNISVDFSYDSNSIVAQIPYDVTLHAASTGQRLNMTVEAELTRMGRLNGSYEVAISLRKPLLNVTNKGLVIENPNIFPLKFNITFIYSDGGPWQYNSTSLTISKGLYEIEAPNDAQYVYVDVRYMWLGAEFYERLRVR